MRQSEHVLPEKNAIFDFFVKHLPLGIDGQEMLEVRIEREIGVDPVAEGQLFLESHGMQRSLARGFGNAFQSFEVFLFRHNLGKLICVSNSQLDGGKPEKIPA